MTTTHGFGIRTRQLAPARHLPAEVGERFQQMLASAERELAQPILGLTADGSVQSGLFSIRSTGVSTKPMKDAADAFLAKLNAAHRAEATFDVASEAWRRWSNIHPFTMRHGALLETMDEPSREAALDVLRASLSDRGFQTSRDIMRLNYTIGEITGSWEEYGEWVYWLSIFGTPSIDEPWGWQIDGHHLIINCFVLGDQVVMTPTFMGSEPVHAESGKFAGTRVLDVEEQKGLELMQGLSKEQQVKAMASAAQPDGAPANGPFDGRLKGGAYRDNLQLPYEGIAASDLSAGQREVLLDLAGTYVGHMRPDHAQVRMDEVKTHLDETSFYWIGGVGDDSVFYYRIHSPMVLIEFDHQRGVAFDNDEPSRNHIHTVVRTPNGGDYGTDLLRQHYARHHKPNGA